ncbi:MAG: response regulator [Deltaproteobacteria bacterium]|nr:response regulator [Deltaproteobacteria bacterium]
MALSPGDALAHQALQVWANEYVEQIIDVREGLPQSSANAVVEDDDGFLWIGTFAGLVRYDGHSFRVFRPGTTGGLPSGAVTRLHKGAGGALWIGTDQGLVVRQAGAFDWFQPTPEFPIRLTESIVTDRQGRVVISGHGRHLFRREEGAFVRLPLPGAPGSEPIDEITLVTDVAGQVYAERGHHLYRLDDRRWVPAHSFGDEWILGLAPRREGGVWVATDRQIHAFDGTAGRPVYPRLEAGFDYLTMFEAQNGDLWTASYIHGATRHRAQAPPLVMKKHHGLPESSIRVVTEDRERNLWIGTDGGGLVRLRVAAGRTYTEVDGLSHDIVRVVAQEAPGRWLVGTHGGGLVHFNQGTFTSVPLGTPRESSGWVWAVSPGVDRWVGLLETGLVHLVDGRPQRVELPGAPRPTVRALHRAADGRVWVATEQGLFVIAGSKVERIGPELKAVAMAEWRGGPVVAVGAEVQRVEGQDLRPILSVQGGEIAALSVDSQGRLWLASEDGRLGNWDGQRLSMIGPADGLPSTRYRSLASDGRGALWAGGNRGLVRILESEVEDLAKGRIRELPAVTLGLPDGLLSAEVNCVEVLQDPRGEPVLAVGTLHGLSVISPQVVEPLTRAPSVFFESLCFVDPGHGPDDPPETCHALEPGTPELHLPPGAFAVRTRYTAPSYFDPDAVHFELVIESPSGVVRRRVSERELTLQVAAPGRHHLSVRAATPHGYWSDRSAELSFTVEPHLWQQAWFGPALGGIVVLALAAVFGSALLGRLRLTKQQLAQERDQHRLEADLVERQRLESLGLLAGGVAHDFNNILTGVLANASFLRTENANAGPDTLEVVDEIEVAARRAAELCRQLLAYAGRGRLTVAPVSLSVLAQEASRLLKASVPARVELQLHLDDAEPLWAQGDEAQLQQVVLNLLLNGIEAIDGPGRVTLRTSAQTVTTGAEARSITGEALAPGSYVLLEIEDTGRGMSPDTRRRIFEPFFSTKGSGRGLGLAAVLGIVRSHQGALSVDSVEGRGSHFRLWLPRTQAPAPTVVPSAASAVEAQAKVVLVIDDEPPIRRVVATALKKLGLQVLQAEDGKLGLERYLAQPRVDLVITDLTMPVMSGEETVQQIRAHRPEQPIIVMSGYDQSEAMSRLQTGVEIYFLRKPFDVQELRRLVTKALD